MRAKICGVKNLKDALYMVKKNAWAIGLNFYPASPRYIDISTSKSIIRHLPHSVVKVGVLPSMEAEAMMDIKNDLGLDLIQVYDDIDAPVDVKKNMILALALKRGDELPKKEILDQYGYLLVDASPCREGKIGGTGRLSDWRLAKALVQSYRVILAGGLTPQNVREAIESVHPFAVDVASGVEVIPGKKSPALIKAFLNEVNDVA